MHFTSSDAAQRSLVQSRGQAAAPGGSIPCLTPHCKALPVPDFCRLTQGHGAQGVVQGGGRLRGRATRQHAGLHGDQRQALLQAQPGGRAGRQIRRLAEHAPWRQGMARRRSPGGGTLGGRTQGLEGRAGSAARRRRAVGCTAGSVSRGGRAGDDRPWLERLAASAFCCRQLAERAPRRERLHARRDAGGRPGRVCPCAPASHAQGCMMCTSQPHGFTTMPLFWHAMCRTAPTPRQLHELTQFWV